MQVEDQQRRRPLADHVRELHEGVERFDDVPPRAERVLEVADDELAIVDDEDPSHVGSVAKTLRLGICRERQSD